MGHQIIKQPNGNYSIYSSVTESIIGYEIPREEIIEYYKKEACKKAEKNTKELLDKIDAGDNPYYQFAETWEDVKKTIPKEWL